MKEKNMSAVVQLAQEHVEELNKIFVPQVLTIDANPFFRVPVSWGKVWRSLDQCLIARETTRGSCT